MDPRLHRRPEPEKEPSELVSDITSKFNKSKETLFVYIIYRIN